MLAGVRNAARGDKQYLYQPRRDGVWYVRVSVPRPHVASMGKKEIIQTLRTTDLAQAQSLRWTAVTRIKGDFDAVAKSFSSEPRSYVEDALEAHRAFKEARTVEEREGLKEAISTIAEKINEDTGGTYDGPSTPAAKAYYNIATGQETPLLANVERWLSGSTYRDGSKSDAKAALSDFESWLENKQVPATIQSINRRLVFDFCDTHFKARNIHYKTANKKLSFIRQYWAWLIRTGHLSEELRNPWSETSLPKLKKHQTDQDGPDGPERPFNKEEMARLFSGDAPPLLLDMMMIAALTGLRIEEIGALKVKNVQDDFFDIALSKTVAGLRRVPIHSALMPLVKRRCGAKESEDYLFHELTSQRRDMKRTARISSRHFPNYRKACGVDDKRVVSTRSKVNFHSFRRWFATELEEAGVSERIINRLMGHEAETESLRTYSKAELSGVMRQAIEHLKLPKLSGEA